MFSAPSGQASSASSVRPTTRLATNSPYTGEIHGVVSAACLVRAKGTTVSAAGSSAAAEIMRFPAFASATCTQSCG